MECYSSSIAADVASAAWAFPELILAVSSRFLITGLRLSCLILFILLAAFALLRRSFLFNLVTAMAIVEIKAANLVDS